VFDVHPVGPVSLFEHAPRASSVTLLNTLWRVLCPPMLWSRLTMFHRVRLLRLIAFSLVATFLMIVVISAVAPYTVDAGTFRGLRGYMAWSAAMQTTPTTLHDHITWYRVLVVAHINHALGMNGLLSGRGVWRLHTVLSFLLMPFAFLLLSSTLRRAKVRPIHLVRVFLYSLPLLPLLLFTWRVQAAFPMLSFSDPLTHGLRALGFDLPLPQGAIVALILTALWWGCACVMYLKLRTGWFVAGLLAIVAFLGALLAVALRSPGGLISGWA